MENRVGQQLGNYRLIRLLGAGGFAEVYLGEHIHLQTQSAIKLLHTQLAQEDMEYFRNEARTLARLVHPNIVRVFDFGVENRTPYLVMDYAPNGTLRQRHPRGTILSLPTIVSYVKQIADALQYAHDEKFIHRDIKPENMLIGRRNEILLSDFGIAIVAQSSRLQSTQEVIGTVSYMAPEQIQAHPRPASDQYSLGIIVYEWLCGSVPFSGSFAEVAVKHTVAVPPPLHERVPSISPEIEGVVMTALQKDPHSRFGTVGAFANAFEQASRSNSHPVVVPTGMLAAEPTVYPSPNVAPPIISQPFAPARGGNPSLTPPIPQTVFQPPLSGVSLNSSVPLSTAAALPNTTGAKKKKRYKPLIDYLIPAKNQSRGARFGRDVLLVIAFGVIFILLFNYLFGILIYIAMPLTGAFLGKKRGMLAFLFGTIIGIILSSSLASIINVHSIIYLLFLIPIFIFGWSCELGIGQRFPGTIFVFLIIAIVTSNLIQSIDFVIYDVTYGYPISSNIFAPAHIILIGLFISLPSLIAAIIVPLLWKLPCVKRNLAKE